MTPATLVIRGTGSAIIAGTDSTRAIAIVPAGTPLDSIGTAATVARMFRLSRNESATAYQLDRLLPE